VATKNSIALSKMLSFNELSEDGILTKNQYLFLEKKSKIGEEDFYLTKAGESLYDIAQKNGIQLQYMLDYNHLWGNEDIKTGTKIYLRPDVKQTNSAAAVVISKTASIAKTHIVEAKEGLYAIARKYNISVGQLKEWNYLQTDSLTIGQELIISK
jgi:LysM repeat protein